VLWRGSHRCARRIYFINQTKIRWFRSSSVRRTGRPLGRRVRRTFRRRAWSA